MRKDRNRILLSIGLLMLYLTYQVGITAFPHVHILNGERLVHSHPSSNPEHSHTADQAIAIARLSSVQTLKAEASFSTDIELPVLYALDFTTDSFSPKAPHTHCIHLRAPPFC